MLAGEASSAATTSSRSSRFAEPTRSTMRNAARSASTGFTRQPIDQGERVALAPVALAEGPPTDLAFPIDEERHRQPFHFPRLGDALLGIDEHRQRDMELLHEPRRARLG